MTAFVTLTGEYETPKITCFMLMSEGVLCESGGGTNEGVNFEDWN